MCTLRVCVYFTLIRDRLRRRPSSPHKQIMKYAEAEGEAEGQAKTDAIDKNRRRYKPPLDWLLTLTQP